jgi:hypothetical protein
MRLAGVGLDSSCMAFLGQKTHSSPAAGQPLLGYRALVRFQSTLKGTYVKT